MLEAKRRAIETVELEDRLTRLEQRERKHDEPLLEQAREAA